LKILKERAIVLTSYEQKSLFRFLALYLSSVFVLLAIIGYLFFENNRVSMKNAMKFEMMYQARMLSSDIIMEAMKGKMQSDAERLTFLSTLKHCRFKVGFYDKNEETIYQEIENFDNFIDDFSVNNGACYTVTEDNSDHMGVHYIVLQENELAGALKRLKAKIIGYLIFSFLLMAIVGYFLGRLFLQPVREQIESLDKFISDTTHELNTPISAILMTIQSLKNIEPKKMERLKASAKRLNVMYGSLTYRLEGKMDPPKMYELDKIILSRVEYFKELIDSKHLKLELSVEKTSVFMTKVAIDRLLDNLLSNAIKYSNVDDSIVIRLKNNILEVRDTGIGIDKKEQKNIFKRYKRANLERGGFGIGLSIVLSICEKYNITMKVVSQPQEGSAFILTFPQIQ